MIWDKIEKRSDKTININDWKEVYSFQNGYDSTPFEDDLKESTYFSCINNISQDVAKCTLQVKKETEKGEVLAKQHYLYDLSGRSETSRFLSPLKTVHVSFKTYGSSHHLS
ncbi:hypothetical protein HYH37_09380 [Clostridium botulinum]|uniref:phage portal protein n=1 Tax=Clostridium botulinum TaxID=1491 RepID=UPI001C9BB677|nr:phage portal protein [Clostridium botulinum]MBY6873393.1 hypothetical protein [Clostridium botulinum]